MYKVALSMVMLIVSLLLAIAFTQHGFAADSCNSDIDSRIKDLWRSHAYEDFVDQVDSYINAGKKDTFDLYYLQIEYQEQLSYAKVCGNTAILLDIARQIDRILELSRHGLDFVANTATPVWVCEQGECVNQGYEGKELLLASVQFNGFLSDISTGLVDAIQTGTVGTEKAREFRRFIQDTRDISIANLNRWAISWESVTRSKIGEPVPQSYTGVRWFTDKEMWMMLIAANIPLLDGYLRAVGEIPARHHLERVSTFAEALYTLFAERAQIRNTSGTEYLAFDNGYHTYYSGNRLAGYAGSSPCSASDTWVRDLSMDTSHYRRMNVLVPAIDGSKKRVETFYDVDVPELFDTDITTAFAASIPLLMWNRDSERPLFTNYSNGSNGHMTPSGKCGRTILPWKKSESFVLTGFFLHDDKNGQVSAVANSVKNVIEDTSESMKSFSKVYYPNLYKFVHLGFRDTLVVNRYIRYLSSIVRTTGQ